MSGPGTTNSPNPDADEEEGQFGPKLGELVGMALRSPRRRPFVAAGSLFVSLLVALAASALMPRSYESDTKILAQRGSIMAGIANPHSTVHGDVEFNTKSAPEIILRHDNLVALVDDANLVASWDSHRQAIQRWKAKLFDAVFGPPSVEDKRRALIGLLERRLYVQTDDQTIHIYLEWDDPKTAFDLVSLTERKFLEGRNAAESAVISDTITILDNEASKVRDEVETAMTDVSNVRQSLVPAPAPAPSASVGATAAGAYRSVPSVSPAAAASAASAASTQKTGALLAEKRQRIREIDEPWQRQLAELRAQLAELKVTYTPAHPAVLTLEEKIRRASEEPPELSALKREEKALLDEQMNLEQPPLGEAGDAKGARPRPVSGFRPAPAAPEAPKPRSAIEEESPQLVAAKNRLQATIRKYEDLMDRTDAARLELITAQAAFKYRFTIVQPPELPRRPKKPDVPKIILAGIAIGILSAFGIAWLRDLAGGKVVEPWQLRQALKVPVLAEVDLLHRTDNNV